MVMKKSPVLCAVLVVAFIAIGCGRFNRLHRAISESDVARVRELLDHGANANNYVYWYGYPLSHAAGTCQIDVIRLLLEHGANTSDRIAELSLRSAVTSCDADVVQLLLQRGIDPNANFYLGGTILMGAIERG